MENGCTTEGKITATTKLSQWIPLAPSYLLSALQVELANLDSIYTLYKPLILTATQLLKKEPSFNGMSPVNKCTKRSLLPFLMDALSWLTGTATTKDVKDIKRRVNQLIESQTQQQDTLVHVMSILSIIRYAKQVYRWHINIVMEAVQRAHTNVTTLFNITSSIYTHINYQEILLYIYSILANLMDSPYYMRQIAIHAMDYINAATTSILSPHILPVEYLREILMHIKAELPSTKHLPVSLNDTLHFYNYLHTHILVAEEQFLLLIDIPIQDCTQQLKIYQVINLFIPRGNLSAPYDIDTRYLGISHDETKAIEILDQQFTMCQWVNGQFCKIEAPFQPLSNPLSCITAIYIKNKVGIDLWCSLQIRNTCSTTIPIPTPIASNLWILTSAPESDSEGITLICPNQAPTSIKGQKPIRVLHLPPACSGTYQHFHLPPHYKNHQMIFNISLNVANLNAMTISSPEFWVWQNLEDH